MPRYQVTVASQRGSASVQVRFLLLRTGAGTRRREELKTGIDENGEHPAMTDRDNPFADGCTVIRCYGAAKPADTYLVSRIVCIDAEIIEWLGRRERRTPSIGQVEIHCQCIVGIARAFFVAILHRWPSRRKGPRVAVKQI